MFIHKCLQVKYKCYDYNDYWLCKYTIVHLHMNIKGCCDRFGKYLQITWQMQMIKRNHMENTNNQKKSNDSYVICWPAKSNSNCFI